MALTCTEETLDSLYEMLGSMTEGQWRDKADHSAQHPNKMFPNLFS